MPFPLFIHLLHPFGVCALNWGGSVHIDSDLLLPSFNGNFQIKSQERYAILYRSYFLYTCSVVFPHQPLNLSSMLLYYSACYRTREYKYRSIERDLLWAIGSHFYGDWKVPLCTVCKQEAQKSGCYSDSPSPKVWGPEELMFNDRRSWIAQIKQRGNVPFSLLFFPLSPSKDWIMPAHAGEGNPLHSVYWFKFSFILEISSEKHP